MGAAQHGFGPATVDKPMRMLVGEAGPKLVSVIPTHKLGGNGDRTRNVTTMMVSSYGGNTDGASSSQSEQNSKIIEQNETII